MDCGIPFCHEGCPLGNLIPEWNDLVYRDDWREAVERLHATNNFPEFTGRLCPAPCEGACVLGINADPVTIERIEYEIVRAGLGRGLGRAGAPGRPTGRRVAVVGSGPAGLAAAQQLTRAGHEVVVYERAERPGRAAPLRDPRVQDGEGRPRPAPGPARGRGRRVPLRCRVGDGRPGGPRARPRRRDGRAGGRPAGRPTTPWCWPVGPTLPRDLPVPGRELDGIHRAMDYLKPSNWSARARSPRRRSTPRASTW